jgi:hypothetical protein
VHINFCIIDILINSCNSYITSHNHVFPRSFICTHRRQPDPSHQATSRTRSRRRKRKTARRGKSPISAFLSLSLPSPIYMLITCATETQRTLLRALHPQTRFFAVLGRIHLLLSVHGKVHVCMERRIQAIHQPHTERSWFWRPHDVNSTLQFSRHYTRPHITRKRRKEREKKGPIV